MKKLFSCEGKCGLQNSANTWLEHDCLPLSSELEENAPYDEPRSMDCFPDEYDAAKLDRFSSYSELIESRGISTLSYKEGNI